MASNYGPHFGVRRADENMAQREGRQKCPTTGSRLLLGSAVEIDFANPGFLKQSASGAAARPGVSGLLIYEDQFLTNASIDASPRVDTANLAYAALGRYAVILSGAGCKFWFKNNAQRTGLDGHVTDAITPVAGLGSAGVANGDYLGWNGTQWASIAAASASQPAAAWFQVVQVNDAASYLEAVLLK